MYRMNINIKHVAISLIIILISVALTLLLANQYIPAEDNTKVESNGGIKSPETENSSEESEAEEELRYCEVNEAFTYIKSPQHVADVKLLREDKYTQGYLNTIDDICRFDIATEIDKKFQLQYIGYITELAFAYPEDESLFYYTYVDEDELPSAGFGVYNIEDDTFTNLKAFTTSSLSIEDLSVVGERVYFRVIYMQGRCGEGWNNIDTGISECLSEVKESDELGIWYYDGAEFVREKAEIIN